MRKTPDGMRILSEEIAIDVEHLTKRFGTRKAVDDVSFRLPEGSFMTIFGSNGAGKTTLLRMISTLSKPTSGKIAICGIDIHEDPDAARMRMGMISHKSMLFPDLSAEENLIFYGELYGVDAPAAKAKELLDAVGLKHRRRDLLRGFSKGMEQRVSIARALMNDPDVVLLDEPYAGLDPNASAILDSLMESMLGYKTVCMVSHDIGKGLSFATHALVLEQGRTISFGSVDDLSEKELYEVYGGGVGR